MHKAHETTAIAPSRGITHVIRRSPVAYLSFEPPESRIAPLVGAVGEAGINIFFIKKSGHGMSLAVNCDQKEAAIEALRGQGIEPSCVSPCGVACVVASNMKYEPGVMNRILGSLHRRGVSILSTSDSFNSVSCLVREEQLDSAIEALCEEFEVEEWTTTSPLDPW